MIQIDIKMPESCYYCRFMRGSWGYSPPHKAWCTVSGKNMPVDSRNVQYNQPSCPVKELPPHGRLIDADAFDARIRLAGGMCEEELTDDFKDGVQTTLKMLKSQPTIIPAEPGEEET